jgi:hypothetical protein
VGPTSEVNGQGLPGAARSIESLDDLVATLERLTDRQRRGFGYWVDPKALLGSGARSRRVSRQFRIAARSFGRLGDGTLTRDERIALRRVPADEACWYDGGRVAGSLADAIERDDRVALERLAPAMEWLAEAARTGADRIDVAIPPLVLRPGEEPLPEPAPAIPMSDFERRFHGPLWGYKGAALFGLVCTIPFASKPSLATPLASFGPPAAAFAVGFAWLLGMMTLVHRLGLKTEWTLVRKQRVLVAAFLAGPIAGLVIARIAAG